MRFYSNLLQRRAAAAETTPTLKKIYDVYMAPDGHFAAGEQGDAANNPQASTRARTASNRVLRSRCLVTKNSSFKLNSSELLGKATELTLVCSRDLVANKLLGSMRMLTFTQPRKMFRFHGPSKLPLLGELTLPFAVAMLVAAPIVLFLGGKLTLVISSGLAVKPAFTGTTSLTRIKPSVLNRLSARRKGSIKVQ